ncbi:hypothetical protein [Pseudomonas chlororaphis]|uniref:hypothetical protein n=1 Tax=Pseudomonas chlororaphis TaxID=587753 RepID=UPI0012DAB699
MTLKAFASFLSVACVVPLTAYDALPHLLPSGDHSKALSILGDGAVLAEYTHLANGNSHAFKYNAGVGMVDLGTVGGKYSLAYRISADGSSVADRSDTRAPEGRHAFVVPPQKPVIPPVTPPVTPPSTAPVTSPFAPFATPIPVVFPQLVGVGNAHTSLAQRRPADAVAAQPAQHLAV